jgi:hypothetical protein
MIDVREKNKSLYKEISDMRCPSLLNIHYSNQNDSDDAAWVLGPKWRPYGGLTVTENVISSTC